MFGKRAIIWITSLAGCILSIIFSFEGYVATILAVVGTYYWVKGTEEGQKLLGITKSPTLKFIRMACFSDGVMGGGMVGLSAALQGVALAKSDYLAWTTQLPL